MIELDKIWKSEYSLKEFLRTQSSNFKTYDELKSRLDDVLSGSQSSSSIRRCRPNTPEVDGDDKQYVDNVVKTTSSDSDDSLDYFQKLDKRGPRFLIVSPYLRDVYLCVHLFYYK